MKAILTLASLSLSLVAVAAPSVDFSVYAGSVRRELHSSGYAPPHYPRQDYNGDADVKAMKLHSARTHNWAIYNSAQRVCDLGLVFPCADLDPADSSNYYFDATDQVLSLARSSNAGSMEIFYTLGNSTDYAGDKAFNGLMPTNFEHTAAVMAGIVRHYNEGWASGKRWGIKYWEIWSTPDDAKNYWYREGLTSTQLRDQFATFFATCLKKLKTEFPTCKFGGPGLSSWNTEWLTAILNACADQGVAPDFISWHAYTSDPAVLAQQPATARAWLDARGYTATEIIIDEWHYLPNNSWNGITKNATSQTYVYLSHDPANSSAVWGIDSGVFNLSVLARLQYTALDRAFYYGCGYSGVGPSSTWAYYDYYGNLNKPYHSLKMFGQVASSATHLVQATSDGTVTVLGATNGDGTKGYLVVSDYKGTGTSLTVNLAGVPRGISNLSAKILDKDNNLAVATASYASGKLTLKKNASGSAAFSVTFDIEPENPPHQHAWGAWTTNVAATCLKPGLATRVCTAEGCTEPPTVQTNVLDALGHDWNAWVTDVEPQIGVPGHKYRDCARCTEHEEEEISPLPPLPPVPTEVTTNAMANASWGYEIHGLGIASNEVALVFTNTAETMEYALPNGVTVVRYLVAAGGGAGGASSGNDYYQSGGGGAGGLLTAADLAAEQVSKLTVAVGAGGAAVSVSGTAVYRNGTDGEDSSLTLGTAEPIVAHGGGGGAGCGDSTGNAGGSGGGAGVSYGASKAAGSTVMTAGVEGYAGGNSYKGQVGGGGGGGAGGAGGGYTDATKSQTGGAGGPGVKNDIMGALDWFCAGGGGGSCGKNKTNIDGGAGGQGGGGAGGKSGTMNTVWKAGSGKTYGCGGGGTSGYGDGAVTRTSGAGYQGVVIVRYAETGAPVPPPAHTHVWSDWTTNVAATCEANGIATRVCTAEGCTEPPTVQTNVLAALGHDWSAWVTDVEPQIGVPGHKYRDCTRCTAHEEEEISPLPPLPPVPTEVTTNAMANASWGYELRGLGAAMDEVALVFTNTTYTSSDPMNYSLPDGVDKIWYLVVGGGGSGGTSYADSTGGGGGGGAGGMLEGQDVAVGSAQISVSVGKGGAAVTATSNNAASRPAGNTGGSSSLTVDGVAIMAHGGGGGGGCGNTAGKIGGSGGGAYRFNTAGVCYDGEGNAGGRGTLSSGNNGGGGGGGAGGAGGNADGASGGKGGDGKISYIGGGCVALVKDASGSDYYCAGGGGGGAGTSDGGAGGIGGGGAGNKYNGSEVTTSGSGNNYGCGGGGTQGNQWKNHTSGAGYQGVVIVRYRMCATPTGKWDEVEASQVDGVTDANKAVVETTLDAIQAALPEGATAAKVGEWLTKVYGNQKVAAETLANAKHVGLSVKYDLPLLVSETPTVTVEVSSDPVSETGVAAFVFTIKDGDTPVSVAQAKVQEMVQYAVTLAGGFAPSTPTEVEVTSDGTSFKAELKRIDGRNSGFMKVELK